MGWCAIAFARRTEFPASHRFGAIGGSPPAVTRAQSRRQAHFCACRSMIIGTILLMLAASEAVASSWAAANPEWVDPIPPFRIVDGVYYVGTKGLSSFLVATKNGHFVIDGGLPENAEIIAENIKELGFDLGDVRFLLNSHAHFDHSGGLAALKEATGAAMIASEGDRPALEGGFYFGSEEDHNLDSPPVKVDRVIGDGESLTLGGVTLTAVLTPGHTKGCTSWKMQAKDSRGAPLDVLFFCSASVAANRLVASNKGAEQYPGIVDDYRATFDKLEGWRPDVFLANHPEFFDMAARRARLDAGDEAAFVDQGAFPAYLTAAKAAFEKALAAETARAAAE